MKTTMAFNAFNRKTIAHLLRHIALQAELRSKQNQYVCFI